MAEPVVIDKGEVLRYLGHRGQAYGLQLDEMINDAIALCEKVARPNFIYSLFDLVKETNGDYSLRNTTLTLSGHSIRRHLDGAVRCVLLAATLGGEIETRIRVAEQRDMTAALVLDAAATTYIEAVCDGAEAEIHREAEALGLYANFRFSPGYGDLPLTVQPTLLSVLDTMRKIGLTCTDSLILLPRKSVTAVIGLFAQPWTAATSSGCETCSQRETCTFIEIE